MLGNSRDDLGMWLKKNRVSEEEYMKCVRYHLDCGDAQLDTHSKLAVMECIKDAYELPYIPGSSLKGMLRTILLAYDIEKNPGKYDDIRKSIEANSTRRAGRNAYLSKETSQMEALLYRTLGRPDTRPADAVNDIMSGMIAGDSKPLSLDDLVLCQRTELHTDGEEKKLNVLRECIKPGTSIHFELTIDTSVCPFSQDDIMQAIEYFSKMYYDSFLRRYSVIQKPEQYSVWLGGGAGFVSKTEVYPLFGDFKGVDIAVDIFKATGVPETHKHYQDRRLKVSPHICKVTYYKGTRCQMGQCEFHITQKK
jgi:CRISPR-associated protein Csm5